MTNEQIIIAVIFIGTVIYLLNRRPDKDGKLPDLAVTKTKIRSLINDFQPTPSPKLKDGYTEKTIQNQLEKFFQTKLQHVTTEYGIEGVNASKIDFDLGNGSVGLELKLASSVFKEAGKDRLVGQVSKYTDRKYDDENFIVVIYCTKDEFQKTTSKNEIVDSLKKYDVDIVFKELTPKE